MERMPRPVPRGEVSAALLRRLETGHGPLPRPNRTVDPLCDDDLQLALYCAYELHHRGIAGVADAMEWDPTVLAWRADVERVLEARLRGALPSTTGRGPVSDELQALIDAADGPSLSQHMATHGTLDEMREFVAHRSAYQRKEADGHTWAVPRFGTPSRCALVTIQLDEYGNGEPGASHHELFETTMRALGLDPTYGCYVSLLPASTLATVNLLSWFGLHRARLGALVGHLATFEMTSVVPMSRYSAALARLGVDVAARRFYDVHVEADAVHSRIAAIDLADRFVAERPELRRDVVFGAQSLMLVEDHFARALLDAWARGRSSLRAPIHALAA